MQNFLFIHFMTLNFCGNIVIFINIIICARCRHYFSKKVAMLKYVMCFEVKN